MRCLENTDNAARLGIIVPKKGNRTAVRRNRIKRIVRDQFRLAQTELLPLDIIVHVVGTIPDSELRNTVERCLKDVAKKTQKEQV